MLFNAQKNPRTACCAVYGGSCTKAVEHNTELQSALHFRIKISEQRLSNFVAHFYSQKCFKVASTEFEECYEKDTSYTVCRYHVKSTEI